MTAPILRPAVPADLGAVERLLTDSKLPLDGVREAFGDFIVADGDDGIVGVAGLEVIDEHALLRSVAVRPEWRSKDVGRALVTRLLADADARGLQSLYLLTTTAERYFPRFGFKPVSREDVPASLKASVEFTSACPASAAVMCRECRRSD